MESEFAEEAKKNPSKLKIKPQARMGEVNMFRELAKNVYCDLCRAIDAGAMFEGLHLLSFISMFRVGEKV